MAEQKHILSKQPISLYTPAGFYMLRAPALPAQMFTRMSITGHLALEKIAPEDLDTALSIQREHCFQLLRDFSDQPQIRQVIAVASPSLQEGLERLQRNEGSPAQQKRALASLLRYLIRMSTRPTPFGLFSGVASGTFASETGASLTSPAIARFRTRPDMSWLLAVLRKLETDPLLVRQLKVQLNQTAYLAGERAVLPFADTYGEQDNRAISLRATSVVRAVFALAQQFIPYTHLQSVLQQTYPGATAEQIDRVLWQLWEHHFLISDLHPPLTDARPDEYVRNYLYTIEGTDLIKTLLTSVLEGASALDRAGIGAPTSLIATLVQKQAELITSEKKDQLPLQIDSVLQVTTPTLHQSVGDAAAQAASFLLRQTPSAKGSRHLLEYQSLFLEKFGEHAEVPLLDLLSPEKGLDAPESYEMPPRAYNRPPQMQPPTADPRNHLLLHLITTAVNTQSLEVELTDEIQQSLERWSPQIEKAPLSLEIYLQLQAASREAIDQGEWTAVVGRNCGSSHGGRTFGRFFDLLDEQGRENLRDLTRREEAFQPDIIFAELSYQPFHARSANVAIRPPLCSYEIAVGTTPSVLPERVISLNDLVVGTQNGRLYLRSLRLGKQVRVYQTHMLNILSAPNVCRFIVEASNHGMPALSAFDWGEIASSPFLPRLVIKAGPSSRLVIAPACWQLQAQTISLLGEGSQEARWFRGLQSWRAQWRVPRYVYLVEMDNRLLLDLENPLMAAELYNELKKDGQKQIALDELLPDFEHLWLRDEQDAGYFSEIVVPLLRTDAIHFTPIPGSEVPASTFSPPPQVISSTERSCFPGEEWVYLKLYAAPGQHEELLAGPLREIVQELQKHQLLDRWFFIRYADPEPHLRLRFHAREGVEPTSILSIVFPWCLQLVRRGQLQRYSLDTYEREVERYGGPAAIVLLEQVFTADSVLISDVLAFQRARRLTLEPLAIAVFTLDQYFALWGYTFAQRQRWTHGASEKYAFSKEFRPDRKRYCDLLSPHEPSDLDLREQKALLLELVHPHETFLGELGAQVRQLAASRSLWVSEDSLMGSLAHMHVNRLLGIGRAREQQIYAFWRHTLDSLERRSERGYAHS